MVCVQWGLHYVLFGSKQCVQLGLYNVCFVLVWWLKLLNMVFIRFQYGFEGVLIR